MAVGEGVGVGAPGSAGVFRAQYVDLPEALELDCGRSLEQVRIAYEIYGRLSAARDNVVLVCHALSGDAHAAGWSDAPDAPSAVDGFGADERGIKPRGGLGWWDGMIGPGKAFDTNRFFVVCANLLGGCRGTTGPSSLDPATGAPFGLTFPLFTVRDLVTVHRALLRALGVARMLAHITYLSAEGMALKFDRARRGTGMTLESDFEVEHYLDHQAEIFLARFDPLTYLYLSRVMDYFEPFATPGPTP